jgi:hypothetical protein
MKKKIYIAALALAVVLPSAAQETYENAKIAAPELNGTARYVGMGGAMEALGADISTMSTNPAGIGLFRKSWLGTSFSIVTQEDGVDFSGSNKTKLSFDQMGFVYSSYDGGPSYINVGINYHKSRNFNYILSAADRLDNASQNKVTYAKAKNELLYNVSNRTGLIDLDDPQSACNQLDDIYANNLNYDYIKNTWYAFPMDDYTMNRAHKGYISEFDFNLSGSINSRVYLGLTVGVYDVNYHHYGEYAENMGGQQRVLVADDRTIKGQGYDVKAGIIFRPIEESALRFGLSVSTPTFYDLTTRNNTDVIINAANRTSNNNNDEYDFRLYTPWKFGLSAGHTIGSMLALGLSYEYADYSSTDSRYKTGREYDWYYDTYTEHSESDDPMNRHTESTLKGVSTLKAGLELKPSPEMAVRLGYNYVSPMYEKQGFKDGTIASMGSYISSATDYTNWKATHRITCGFGYSFGQLNLSAAYQYNVTKGDFWPFMSYVDNYDDDSNIAHSVSVSNKRHQVMMTLGYTF